MGGKYVGNDGAGKRQRLAYFRLFSRDNSTGGWVLRGFIRADPGTLHIESKASQIGIRIYQSGFLSAFGDNHVIALNRLSGAAKSSGKAWEVDKETPPSRLRDCAD